MPFTPLTSTRSGTRSAYFGAPFVRIEDTTGLWVPWFGSEDGDDFYHYPAIRWGVSSNVSSGSLGYSFQCLKNTTEFGLYYPTMDSDGSSSVSLSDDYASLNVNYEYGGLSHPNYDYINTLVVDETVFALGPNPSTGLVGPIVRPVTDSRSGLRFQNQFVDGLAELFGVTTDAYDNRYLILADGSWHNAYSMPVDELPSGDGSSAAIHSTMNDGLYNYTLFGNAPQGSSTIPYTLAKWQSSTYGVGGSFTSECFSITLSDAGDDAIWQAYFAASASNGKFRNIYSNGAHWVFVCYADDTGVFDDITPRSAATVFIFNMAMTSYERVDVTFQTGFNWASYYYDIDGRDYALGSDTADGTIIYSTVGAPPLDAAALRAWKFPQDNHEFYVIQLGALTLVYDKLSDMWAQWKSPDFDYFRGADGCEWKGINVCCDTESGKVWQIDPTGRLDYGTTPITSQVFSGLTERFRTFVPCYMAELAVSEGQPPTGIDASTVGIQLRSGDGLTWYDHGTVPGEAIGDNVTVRWYGIGLMQSPGKVFEITDTGYARCISGFTIETGKFDIATSAKYKADETSF